MRLPTHKCIILISYLIGDGSDKNEFVSKTRNFMMWYHRDIFAAHMVPVCSIL